MVEYWMHGTHLKVASLSTDLVSLITGEVTKTVTSLLRYLYLFLVKDILLYSDPSCHCINR